MDAPIYRCISQVAFGDTDASGWLHFPQMFRFIEEAEHAFLKSIGLLVFDRQQGGWPRVHVSCDFKTPLLAGDRIEVLLFLTHIGTSSLTWKFEVNHPSGALAATGQIITVRVDATGKSQPISSDERSSLQNANPSH